MIVHKCLIIFKSTKETRVDEITESNKLVLVFKTSYTLANYSYSVISVGFYYPTIPRVKYIAELFF